MSFKQKTKTSFQKQYETNKVWRKICESQGLSDKSSFPESYEELPYLEIASFKANKGHTMRIANKGAKISVIKASSATSGNPSLVPNNQEDLKLQMQYYGDFLKQDGLDLVLGYFPSPEFLKNMGREMNELPVIPQAAYSVQGIAEQVPRFEYLLKPTGKKEQPLAPDMEKTVSLLEEALNEELVVGFGGSPIVAYGVMKGLEGKGLKYDLPKGSRLVTGAGGWSGRKGRTIDEQVERMGIKGFKKEFTSTGERVLGLKPSLARDGYGTAEVPALCQGTWDESVEDYLFNPHPEQKVLIVSTKDWSKPVSEGEQGVARFINPTGASSYMGLSLAGGDIFKRIGEDKFTYVRRLKEADKTGCAAYARL